MTVTENTENDKSNTNARGVMQNGTTLNEDVLPFDLNDHLNTPAIDPDAEAIIEYWTRATEITNETIFEAQKLQATYAAKQAERRQAQGTTNGQGGSDDDPKSDQYDLFRGLKICKPSYLYNHTPETADWHITGFVAAGAITEVIGPIKRAGKTTLTLAACRAAMDGIPFIECDTKKTKILYITEQTEQTFRIAMARAHIDPNDDEQFRYITQFERRKMDWDTLINTLREFRQQVWAFDILVIDTITKIAGIKEENAAADWDRAYAPLQDAASEGAAIVVIRHASRRGGKAGVAGRGSTAASGNVDIIVNLTKEDSGDPTHRTIDTESRYDETPNEIVVRMEDGRYERVGTTREVAKNTAEACVMNSLRNDGAQSAAQLVEHGATQRTPISKRAIERSIETLYAEGRITRDGRGVANNPYTYSISTPE